MRSWVLAAGLLAAAAVPPALAADLGDGTGYYDDWRNPPHSFDDGNGDDSNGDDDDNGHYDGASRADKYSGVRPPYGRTCVRIKEVRDRLTSLGWRDFHAGRPRHDLVTLRARRSNGRLFELTLERCSGQLVDARPLEPRTFGPYAFKAPRERYGPGRRDRYRERGPWFERPPAHGWQRRWFGE